MVLLFYTIMEVYTIFGMDSEFLHAALGAFLQRDENGCHKEQHRHM